jgi:hypothetical protein
VIILVKIAFMGDYLMYSYFLPFVGRTLVRQRLSRQLTRWVNKPLQLGVIFVV